ncbi:class I lanthipeptide [Flavobacterium sp. 1355]|nr:class I lanthipeptide [Flavobacterium sp. 1355]MBP1221923.1 hypothetical protein [Flavobacterium sp. 1355]
MKRQGVNNKLAFNSLVVAELNDKQMQDVDGGSTPISFLVISYLLSKV